MVELAIVLDVDRSLDLGQLVDDLGGIDLVVLRTDAEGEEIWSRTYGGSDYDVCRSVRELPDGSYVMAGYAAMFRGTGDVGYRDADGFLWFVGRKDDVITSAGYRIGPAEIEDCLMKHPAVAMVAVVGSPDEIRTEIVKAFIVPKADVDASAEVAADIKEFVKLRLAAHEYPREIEFVDALPMTATGKIMRKDLKALEIQRKSKA